MTRVGKVRGKGGWVGWCVRGKTALGGANGALNCYGKLMAEDAVSSTRGPTRSIFCGQERGGLGVQYSGVANKENRAIYNHSTFLIYTCRYLGMKIGTRETLDTSALLSMSTARMSPEYSSRV